MNAGFEIGALLSLEQAAGPTRLHDIAFGEGGDALGRRQRRTRLDRPTDDLDIETLDGAAEEALIFFFKLGRDRLGTSGVEIVV
ncbi:hypothetical protein, partial [Rhizobium leguminosarum]|uniref:hypothetical protein n=1 Tax=Rhizobium leguminosarum TaxID=384 RepID=UPI003F964F31